MSRKAQQSESYEVGDRVEYYAIGGATGGNEQSTTVGEICDILTERAPAGDTGVNVRASDENPRYVFGSDRVSPHAIKNVSRTKICSDRLSWEYLSITDG